MAVTIAAAAQPLVGELLQLLAVPAGGVLVMVVAVEADHGADRLLLPLEPGVHGHLVGAGRARGVGVMGRHEGHCPDLGRRGLDTGQTGG